MSAEDAFKRRYGIDAQGDERTSLLEREPALLKMLERRVVRSYADRNVAADVIDALLDVAFAAPSKSDFQQASVIRVDDPTKRRDLAALVPAMPFVGTAPVFLV